MVPDDVTATSLVSLDDDVITTTPEISEGDIIEELRDRQNKVKRKKTMMRCQLKKHLIL